MAAKAPAFADQARVVTGTGCRSPGPCPVRPTTSRRLRVVANSPGPGGNVLDKPSTTPGISKRPDSLRRKPPFYRVLLHNDNYNKREYVVRVLLKVVEGYTVEDAVNVMQEAHRNGLALVTQCAQEVAERYCESMRLSGLIATIEPAGPSGKAA